jgi:hypothetical protein
MWPGQCCADHPDGCAGAIPGTGGALVAVIVGTTTLAAGPLDRTRRARLATAVGAQV